MRDLLRHTLATLAYRGGKAIRDTPAGFAGFHIAEGARTPVEILAHIGDLFDWAVWLAKGEHRWADSPPQSWDAETARFFDGLARLDALLASDAEMRCPLERLFQGPIADAFTHIGQIALIRRAAGVPVRAENYYRADIAEGRVGREQAPPRREF